MPQYRSWAPKVVVCLIFFNKQTHAVTTIFTFDGKKSMKPRSIQLMSLWISAFSFLHNDYLLILVVNIILFLPPCRSVHLVLAYVLYFCFFPKVKCVFCLTFSSMFTTRIISFLNQGKSRVCRFILSFSGKSTLLNHLFHTNFREMDAYKGRYIC